MQSMYPPVYLSIHRAMSRWHRAKESYYSYSAEARETCQGLGECLVGHDQTSWMTWNCSRQMFSKLGPGYYSYSESRSRSRRPRKDKGHGRRGRSRSRRRDGKGGGKGVVKTLQCEAAFVLTRLAVQCADATGIYGISVSVYNGSNIHIAFAVR